MAEGQSDHIFLTEGGVQILFKINESDKQQVLIIWWFLLYSIIVDKLQKMAVGTQFFSF